jgi:tRNA A37 threonylcarbamoyladenosine dehydratase
MRERALWVQAELTSIANEVVVLVTVGGAGSTATRGLAGRLVVVAGDDVDGSASTVLRLAGRTSACQ